MARPFKSGLDYFPLDVHDDDKLKFIRIKFKMTGVGIVFELYRKIYADNFYTKWSDDEALMFSDSIKAEFDMVQNVVDECVSRGIFDFDKFTNFNILTSKGIQDRFAEATWRRKNCKYNFNFFVNGSKLDTLRGDYVDTNLVNVDNNPSSSVLNVDKSTQSKVKESKVKESKVKKSKEENKNTLSIPSEKTIKKITNASDDLEFMAFYNRYNHKKGKDQAFKAWKKLNKADRIEAFEKVEHYFSTIKEGISKVHPSTYLNNKRWTDEVSHDTTKPRLSTGMGNMKGMFEDMQNQNLEFYTEPSALAIGGNYEQ